MYKFDFTFSPSSSKVREISWMHYKDGIKKAQEENKLALLVISASWCHWCHVLDETTFSDDGVISRINDELIAIRADADLEPEIEARYSSEGLPVVSILSPHGIALGGGNFFTAQELMALVSEAQNFYRNQRKYYFDKKEEFEKQIETIRKQQTIFDEKFDPEKLVKDVIIQAVLNLDPEEIGFGEDAKFPHPEMLDFLLSFAEYEEQEELLEMPVQILNEIVDKLLDSHEGGFFRYARERDWTNPQTDKHLYDNSMILEVLVHAARLTGSDTFKTAVKMTLNFIEKFLKNEDGLYGICRDADDEFYQLSAEQRNASRKVPRIVYETVSAYNLRYASALIEASVLFKDESMLAKAEEIVGRLLTEPFFDGNTGLIKRARNKDGFHLQDSVELLNTLVKLNQATSKETYLSKAAEVYFAIKDNFYDAQKLAFRDRVSEPDDDGALKVSYHPLSENCLVAGNIYQLMLKGAIDAREKAVADSILQLFAQEVEGLGPFAGPLGKASLLAMLAKEAN